MIKVCVREVVIFICNFRYPKAPVTAAADDIPKYIYSEAKRVYTFSMPLSFSFFNALVLNYALCIFTQGPIMQCSKFNR